MSALDEIFKAYDIRAVVPDQLDAELARKIGTAFAAFAQSPTHPDRQRHAPFGA